MGLTDRRGIIPLQEGSCTCRRVSRPCLGASCLSLSIRFGIVSVPFPRGTGGRRGFRPFFTGSLFHQEDLDGRQDLERGKC